MVLALPETARFFSNRDRSETDEPPVLPANRREPTSETPRQSKAVAKGCNSLPGTRSRGGYLRLSTCGHGLPNNHLTQACWQIMTSAAMAGSRRSYLRRIPKIVSRRITSLLL